jgi:hypothetical protein
MRFLYVWFRSKVTSKFTSLFQKHSIIFGLMQFGTDNPWQHLSHVGGQQKVISLSCHQSRVWFHYIGDKSHGWCSSLFNSTGFCYQKEKCKSTASSAIQLKKLAKDNQYWREIRCNKPIWKRWTHCWHMLYAAHISIWKIHDNANRITRSTMTGIKVFV